MFKKLMQADGDWLPAAKGSHMNVLLFIMLVSPVSLAYEKEGINLPDTITLSDGNILPLYSTGLLRYKVVFKGYVAALYKKGTVASFTPDDAIQITFHYFWDIEGSAFAKASQEQLSKQLSKETLARLQPKIDTFHNLYTDIKEGERYHLRFHPSKGTSLYHNGTLLGTVKGRSFAEAYFNIWLGNKPLSESLKKQLHTRIGRK